MMTLDVMVRKVNRKGPMNWNGCVVLSFFIYINFQDNHKSISVVVILVITFQNG